MYRPTVRYESLRSIRVVKVKGKYGTYLIKDWEQYERAIGTVFILVAIVVIIRLIKVKIFDYEDCYMELSFIMKNKTK